MAHRDLDAVQGPALALDIELQGQGGAGGQRSVQQFVRRRQAGATDFGVEIGLHMGLVVGEAHIAGAGAAGGGPLGLGGHLWGTPVDGNHPSMPGPAQGLSFGRGPHSAKRLSIEALSAQILPMNDTRAPAASIPAAAVACLSLAAFGSGIALRVNDALLPRLSREFDVSLGQAAQVISVFAIAYGLAQLLFGPLGDPCTLR
eukprot:Opistho-1_new@53692